jgi:predicted SAM-dependent methyltransferase
MQKLNIGCGPDIKVGFDGVDKLDFGQKYIVDIQTQVLPVEDNSVDEILCMHVLEHLNDPLFAINEFWRVLSPDGKLTIIVPHRENNKRAYVIDHTRYFDEYSFEPLESQLKRKWKIVWQKVNERPDIVLELIPIKNEEIKSI